jgi:ATP-dependent DNA ligase
MLAKLSTLPADQAQWAFEIKWDGIRAIGRCEAGRRARGGSGRLQLLTRNEIDRTARYPELATLGEALGSHSAMLDGEIVTFDEQGRPSFQGPADHDAPSARAARSSSAGPGSEWLFFPHVARLPAHGVCLY